MRILDKKRIQTISYRGAECTAKFVSELKVEIVTEPKSMLPIMGVVHDLLGENEAKSRPVFVTDLEKLSNLSGIAKN